MNLIPKFIYKRIENNSNLIKIVDNISWLFFDKFLRMGIGLFVGVWIARYLGPEKFGLLSFATAFVALFVAIAGLGLQGIVVRDIVYDPAGKEETLGTAFVMQFVGGLLAYGFLLGIIFWLRPDDALARALVAILGSMMLFKFSEVANYWFESQVLSKYTVWVQNGSFIFIATIKVVIILNNGPLIAFAWATMAEMLIVALLMVVMLSLRGPRVQLLRITVARTKTLLKDSWPLLLSGIAITIYMKIDQIMLGQIVGDEAVGLYNAAVKISEVWYFIPVAIVASIFPSIIEAKKKSEELYLNRLQRLYDLMVWLSVGVALPMTFLSTPIVTLLFGDAYATSGVVLAIHIWASVFVFLGIASGKWFLVENKQIISFQRTLLGAVVNVILNILLIPTFNLVGAAVATVVAYAIPAYFFDLINNSTYNMFVMKTRAFNLSRIFIKVK